MRAVQCSEFDIDASENSLRADSEALGITVPPSVLLRADEVIE